MGTRLPSLAPGVRFERGPGRYKYTAIVPSKDARGGEKRVHFGHKDYEQYRDRVPKARGGGLWSHKDHRDVQRRANYRRRHEGVRTKDGSRAYEVPYSPSWFSYHFLW